MNRRKLIVMEDSEIETFLHERNSMTLATINLDGSPNLVAMWYGFYGDGSVGMWTFAKSQKAVNLSRDPRLTCLIETGDTYATVKGVEIKGRAELLKEQSAILEIGKSLYGRYFGELDDSGVKAVEKMSNKRVAIKVVVDKIISWDHSKLNGIY